MRILFTLNKFMLGGAEELAIGLAVGLKKLGVDCAVVAINADRHTDDVGTSQKERLAEAGIEHFEFRGPGKYVNAALAPLRLALLTRRLRPDTIHSHTVFSDVPVAVLGRLLRIPLSRTMHHPDPWVESPWIGFIAERSFCNELVVLPSCALQERYVALRKRYRLPESTAVTLIHNGVPVIPEEGYVDRAAIALKLGGDPKKILLGFAGRFHHQKGFDTLLDALQALAPSDLTKIEVHAIGDGTEMAGHQDMAKRRQLPVYFHRPMLEVSRAFPAFDALLMPSRIEGLPLVGLEAMMAGVPVIGTSCPGLNEVYPPGWPLTVQVEDSDGLAAMIKRFISGAYDVAQLKDDAKTWGRKHFTLDKMVERYLEAFEDYLQQTRPKYSKTVCGSAEPAAARNMSGRRATEGRQRARKRS